MELKPAESREAAPCLCEPGCVTCAAAPRSLEACERPGVDRTDDPRCCAVHAGWRPPSAVSFNIRYDNCCLAMRLCPIFATPRTVARQAPLSSAVSCSSLKFVSTQSAMIFLSFSAAHSSRPESFLASGSFTMSWVFASGGQRIGASASASALPVNIQG